MSAVAPGVVTDEGNPVPPDKRFSPEIVESWRGRRILDFGCGIGRDVIWLQERGFDVWGLELRPELCAHVPNCGKVTGQFDVIYSVDSMEHFPDPLGALCHMKERLTPGGRVFISFQPPWLHPYGSHLHYMTKLPWVHLYVPERVLMKWREKYVQDGARHFEEVSGGLNRMTIRKFKSVVMEAGLQFESFRIRAIRDMQFLVTMPLLREFFAEKITATIALADGRKPKT